jgi:hypothetical protein
MPVSSQCYPCCVSWLSRVSDFQPIPISYQINHALLALALASIIIDTTLPTEQVVKLEVKAETMSLAAQGATTILCTILISGYLIFKQWQQRRLIGM